MDIKRSLVDEAMESIADEIRVHHTYEGRSMYGKKCLGLEADRLNVVYTFMVQLSWCIANDNRKQDDEPWVEPDGYDQQEIWNELMEGRERVDNMGNNYLVYWPHIQIIPDLDVDAVAAELNG